jgi:hypothetical protein
VAQKFGPNFTQKTTRVGAYKFIAVLRRKRHIDIAQLQQWNNKSKPITNWERTNKTIMLNVN